jgi:hypothetical protein
MKSQDPAQVERNEGDGDDGKPDDGGENSRFRELHGNTSSVAN